MNKIILTTEIVVDDIVKQVSKSFDYDFEGISTFEVPSFDCPKEFYIGVIVGSSGSGKTQLLKNRFGFEEKQIFWDRNKAIVSHFSNFDEAIDKMFAVGIASIPTLCKPHHVLSNGERHRSDIARLLQSGAIIDEFTSVVNRETAKSLSTCISKYIRKNNLRNVIFSTCHRDIVEWLEPDWVFDCDSKNLNLNEIDINSLKKVGKIEIYST